MPVRAVPNEPEQGQPPPADAKDDLAWAIESGIKRFARWAITREGMITIALGTIATVSTISAVRAASERDRERLRRLETLDELDSLRRHARALPPGGDRG